MTLKAAMVMIVQVSALMVMSVLSVPSLALDLGGRSLELKGEALVEIGPFGLDVYIARFFEGADHERLLELEYVRDVASKIFPHGLGRRPEKFFGFQISECNTVDIGDNARRKKRGSSNVRNQGR